MVKKLIFLMFSVSLFLGPVDAQPAESFDIVIRGGKVLDGTGNPWRYADIAIKDGRVVRMGRLGDVRADRTLDASGMFVTPGFIDTHSHAAEGLGGSLNHALPILAQGITTVMVNPDGGGSIDIAKQRSDYETRGTGINTALFVPHGSIRREVLGMSDRTPTSEELDIMVELVRDGMKVGAIGLSSGLYYAPGSYAKTEEVIVMAKAAAERGGVYSSHIRDESDYSIGVVAAVEEVIRVAEEAKLPGIVTHMKALGKTSWGLSVASTVRIELARQRGVEVYVDQYPYNASGTSISGALVQRWAQVGGNMELRKRMQGSERSRLTSDIRINIERRGGPETLILSRFRPDPTLEGRSLAELSQEWQKSSEEVALDLLARGGASLISFNMFEQDIEHIMRQPYTMTCTDGGLTEMGVGKPHPRYYGAFPRKLRLYVREREVVNWPFAIRSMTSLPATVFGLKDRGVLRPNSWADILVFDPSKITDKATFDMPHQLSEGIAHVLVNGQLGVDTGQFTRKLSGKVLTPERN